jgi:hypothetical protein
MCYECACGSQTAIRSSESITDETFQRAADGAGISVEEAKRNTLELLKRELEKPASSRSSKRSEQTSDNQAEGGLRNAANPRTARATWSSVSCREG